MGPQTRKACSTLAQALALGSDQAHTHTVPARPVHCYEKWDPKRVRRHPRPTAKEFGKEKEALKEFPNPQAGEILIEIHSCLF